jgi:small neutral amino acid transporter SnatA (MarC family)
MKKTVEKENNKHIITKIIKILKIVLFITMLVLSYIVSDKLVDFISTLDILVVKRVLNLILVVVLVFLFNKNN